MVVAPAHRVILVMLIILVALTNIDREEKTHSTNKSICGVVVGIAHVPFDLSLFVCPLVIIFLKSNLALLFGFTESYSYNSIVKSSSIGVVSGLASSLTITEADEACARVLTILVNLDILYLTKLREHRLQVLFSSRRMQVLNNQIEELHRSLELIILLLQFSLSLFLAKSNLYIPAFLFKIG